MTGYRRGARRRRAVVAAVAALLLSGCPRFYDGPLPGEPTEATYAELLRFPIEPGTSFSAVGTVTDGTFRGIPYAATDTYDISVDAIGELRLPSLTFTQAHRVRTTLTVEPALGEATSVRQVSYFFECFGEVARATSQPDEPETNFTEAAEIRRLGY